MRERIARAIVRIASRCLDKSYIAWVKYDKGEEGDFLWESEYWANRSREVQKYFFPIARKFDKESMVDQLIEEGWWG